MNWTNSRLTGSVGSLHSLLFGFFFSLAEFLKPIRLMAITERDPGAAPVAPVVEDDAPSEFARIVTVAVFKSSLDISGWDANTDTEWQALIDAGDLFSVGPVRGMLPEPSMNTAAGYGFLDQRKVNHQYDVPFAHLGITEATMSFWDTISDQPGNWSCMFVFEDLTGYIFAGKSLIPVPMNFNARPSSNSEDIGDERKMMVNTIFKTKRLPYQLDLSASSAIFKKN